MAPFNPLAKILDEHKLTGPNYLDWKMNLMLVLTTTKVHWVPTTEEPELPGPDAPQQQHIGMAAVSDIMLNIKKIFREQHRTVRLLVIRGLISTKMVEGTPVRDHMLKMMGSLNELDISGAIMDAEMQIDIILSSLCGSFKEFFMTYQ
ncbi:uncharacterized protein LOC143857445 [Tasmannia lanceolata]|uniref:uncharacterized protein LOC143857445 n=1 Tax=Tasmannia lanceolata TaxID=3420 RepID=UPI0040637206